MCSYLYVKDTCARQHLLILLFLTDIFFFLFVLIWVFFVAYIRDLLLYLIKLVTLSQVLHFDDGAAVWVCLCSRTHHDDVWEETATASIRAGWF